MYLNSASAAQPPVPPPHAYSDAPSSPAALDLPAHTHIRTRAKQLRPSHLPHASAASPAAPTSAADPAEHTMVAVVALPPSCDGIQRTISRMQRQLAMRHRRSSRLQLRQDLQVVRVLVSSAKMWRRTSATMLGSKVQDSRLV
jgi:hypothetical protein